MVETRPRGRRPKEKGEERTETMNFTVYPRHRAFLTDLAKQHPGRTISAVLRDLLDREAARLQEAKSA